MSGSDSSDDEPKTKKKVLHFGSLASGDTVQRMQEIDEQAQLASQGGVVFDKDAPLDEVMEEAEAESQPKPLVQLLDQPNINVSNETMDMEKIVDPMKEQVLAEFDRRRRAKQLTLPTDDDEVKRLLRKLSVPICLFGEDRPDRRERLRVLLSNMAEDSALQVLHEAQPQTASAAEDEETWYHEGPNELRDARMYIAQYSLPRARDRLARLRDQRDTASQDKARRLQETHKWVRSLNVYGSQVGDDRPVGFCEFSPDSKHIATSSWSGLCKVWSVPECNMERTLRGHNSRCMCIRWHPFATITAQPNELHMASSGEDGIINLWDGASEEPMGQITGHDLRVSRLAFHPSGRFMATCCHDHSWRLYDLEADTEVLHQEGHSKPVFDIDFQQDGSLAVTGGIDAYGRVWDLRTGRCIMFMEGHQRDIHTVAFAPNGFNMASGSADNSIKLWDLRMRRCRYTIPAHHSLVSRIRFCHTTGNYMVSASYDNTIKLWIHPGWQQIQSLQTGNKVMCVDVSQDANWIASTSYDRTLKLWTKDDTQI